MILEWFYNICDWISINWKTIVGTITSLTLGGTVVDLIAIGKQRKALKVTTDATNDLNTSTKELSETKKEVNENTQSINKMTDQVNLLKQENESLKETVNETNSKLDTLLEVFSIVYGTLKDDTVRSTVQNLLMNAKYAATNTRAELQKEINELKAKVTEDAEKLKEEVLKVADDVDKSLGPKIVSTRY